jgi:hypothetical protein
MLENPDMASYDSISWHAYKDRKPLWLHATYSHVSTIFHLSIFCLKLLSLGKTYIGVLDFGSIEINNWLVAYRYINNYL